MSVTAAGDRGAFQWDLRRWRRRSHLVRLARVLLPIMIIAILGGAVSQAVWRTVTDGDRKPAQARAQIRMISPRFYGQSSDGRAFVITARSAVRDEVDLKRVFLDTPTLTLGVGTDAPTRLNAKRGVYREDTLQLRLIGDVRLDDGMGYRFASEESLVDTRTGDITGETSLQGEGPIGRVQSQAYSVYEKGDRIVFRGGVRARIDRQPSNDR